MTTVTFDRCLAKNAVARADDLAVFDATVSLTYRELDAKVEALAHRLAAHEVTVGARVALIADNSAQYLVTAFAIWRASGTLVTIYPSSTESEFRYALTAAQPSLVIAGTRMFRAVVAAVEGLSVTTCELKDDGDVIGLMSLPDHRDLFPIRAEELALICYTSGSTANPKAVMHTHAGLSAAAVTYAEVWHLGPHDTTLVALPLAWAFGLVTTSMATLTGGGSVLLLARSDPADMLLNFADHKVTFFAGVTTMFVKMLQTLEADADGPILTTLRLCISGGEPRNEDAFERWHELTGCPVHDVYAASECFPVVTYDPVADPMPRPGCAGRVVPGARLRIVDVDGRDIETGAPGEAWTHGPATTVGYWGDPELTAATLTADGWYRTGDLVDIDPEGYVRVLGRLTDMIIRGGANVSPAEVEAVLTRHPDVREATVVGLPDHNYGQCVVAAVVLEPGVALDTPSLREHCAQSLAGYKVPTRFVAMSELPHNASTGKVHRREVAKALCTPDSRAISGNPA